MRCPALLVHDRGDRTAPFSDAERLCALAGVKSQLLPVAAGHGIGEALEPHSEQRVGFLHRSFALQARS